LFRRGNLGNITAFASAIEFAVRGLDIEHIVVLGHALCGGIGTFLSPASLSLA
jgi:carbonic anhydrase